MNGDFPGVRHLAATSVAGRTLASTRQVLLAATEMSRLGRWLSRHWETMAAKPLAERLRRIGVGVLVASAVALIATALEPQPVRPALPFLATAPALLCGLALLAMPEAIAAAWRYRKAP
jgi:hypothetical protein